MSSVETIKEKLDISDIIGSYIKLEKAGANFKALCPFHHEKTASFLVSPSRGTYYCFGCGAKGDMFSFVQEFEGVDFITALKQLADKAGVKLEDYPRNSAEDAFKKRLHRVLESATKLFEENLEEEPEAFTYLEKRGLSKETIKEWRVGYAKNEWRALYDRLTEKEYTENEIQKAGLIKESSGEGGVGAQNKKKMYDVFRGRIVFPLRDPAGEVIAFSGRILVDDGKSPKYLNTPETILFNKSETLYGLDKAKVPIRKLDYAILVEGQMDLLMSHQAGFGNTVASSGTAFTEAHLRKLQKLSNRIMLAFDADKAGFVAALKSATLAMSLGMEVKIARLPKGSDPAELIKKGIEGWKDALRNAEHLIDFHLGEFLRDKGDKRTLAKNVEKRILPYLTLLRSSIEQSHFVSTIAKKTGLREEAIWADLRKLPKMAHREPLPKHPEDLEHLPSEDMIERRIEKLVQTDNDKEVVELVLNIEEDLIKEQLSETTIALAEAGEAKDEGLTLDLTKHADELGKELSRLNEERRASI